MMYTELVEKQKYLTTLRIKNEAFKYIDHQREGSKSNIHQNIISQKLQTHTVKSGKLWNF